jgi:hypothetical protein
MMYHIYNQSVRGPLQGGVARTRADSFSLVRHGPPKSGRWRSGKILTDKEIDKTVRLVRPIATRSPGGLHDSKESQSVNPVPIQPSGNGGIKECLTTTS